MDCGLCKHKYNERERVPRILPQCGHTFCGSCLSPLVHNSTILCPDCGQKGNCHSSAALPVNHAILALPASSGVQINAICSTHGKPLEAFCPETFTVLCVDCLLSKAYKGKVVKPMDEAYKESLELLNKDIKTCEELLQKGQDSLMHIEQSKVSLEDHYQMATTKLDSFYTSVISIIEESKGKALGRLEREWNDRRERIELTMRDIRARMVEASDIGQDKFLDKIEVLKRVKVRKDLVVGVKKCLGSLPVKTMFDSIDFNSKSESESLISEIRSFFEDSTRPSTAATKSKASTPYAAQKNIQKSQANPASTKAQVLAKTEKNDPIPIKKGNPSLVVPQNTGSPQQPRSKTPGQTGVVLNYAEKRNEMKLQKHGGSSNNAIAPPVFSEGPKPSQTKQNNVSKPSTQKNPLRHSKEKDSLQANPSLQIQGYAAYSSTPTQANHSSNQVNLPQTAESNKDISKMTIKYLEDQKVSFISDTMQDFDTKWDRRRENHHGSQGHSAEQQRKDQKGTATFMDKLNKAATGDDSCSEFLIEGDYPQRINNRVLISDSKDHTYDIEKYLETLNTPSVLKTDFGPIKPQDNPLHPSWKVQGPLAGGLHYDQISKQNPSKVFTSVLNQGADHQQKESINTGKIICIGGCTEDRKMAVEIFDPTKGHWSIAERTLETRQQFGMVPISRTNLLLFGGVGVNPQVIPQSVVFSTLTGTFTNHHLKLSTPKYSFCYLFQAPKLYIIGGVAVSPGAQLPSADVEEYDVVSGECRTVPSLKEARSEASCVQLGSSIVVIGGRGVNGQSLKSVERFDRNKGCWESLPDLLIARRSAVAEVVGDSLYVIGGFDGEKFLCSVEK
jgi:hypothetical protein